MTVTRPCRCCTHLLSVEMEPDTLHAVMRLLLCLTRQPSFSKTFMRERGPHALFALTQRSNFQGFSSLSTLLIRHVLEDGPLLDEAMESIIRAVVAGSGPLDRDMKTHGPGRRDFDFVLHRLAPCASRNRDLFMKKAIEVLRLTNLPPKPEEYSSSSQRLQPTILKCSPYIKQDPKPLSLIQQQLLNLLMDHLCADAFLAETTGAKDSTQPGKIDEDTSDSTTQSMRYGMQHNHNPRLRRGSYRRQVTDNDDDDDLRSEDMILDGEPVSETNQRSSQPSTSKAPVSDTKGKEAGKDGEKTNEQPLLSQAAILRMLAEMIESYPSCARMIIESTRKIKIGDGQTNAHVTKVACYY